MKHCKSMWSLQRAVGVRFLYLVYCVCVCGHCREQWEWGSCILSTVCVYVVIAESSGSEVLVSCLLCVCMWSLQRAVGVRFLYLVYCVCVCGHYREQWEWGSCILSTVCVCVVITESSGSEVLVSCLLYVCLCGHYREQWEWGSCILSIVFQKWKLHRLSALPLKSLTGVRIML